MAHVYSDNDLRKRQGKLCFYCRKPIGPAPYTQRNPNGYTRDHFVPYSQGHGLYLNKVLAHAHCNGKKSDRPPTICEAYRFRKLYRLAFLPAHVDRAIRASKANHT